MKKKLILCLLELQDCISMAQSQYKLLVNGKDVMMPLAHNDLKSAILQFSESANTNWLYQIDASEEIRFKIETKPVCKYRLVLDEKDTSFEEVWEKYSKVRVNAVSNLTTGTMCPVVMWKAYGEIHTLQMITEFNPQ